MYKFHLRYILLEVLRICTQRLHLLFKATGENSEYEKARQQLQIEDLNRYGIFTYLVNDYGEITDILSKDRPLAGTSDEDGIKYH